ncbi:hypothetical protein SEA_IWOKEUPLIKEDIS_98 [Mycobacterium phage Iwokeuplikedis]|nr:hypothetical protein SEA_IWOKEUPLIKEDIS_98 [Mycobacterium phage Iwokeuplikedis]
MSAFAEHREVRVTRRKSITMPFVPDELSPVRTVDQELDKGLKGWTDPDVKIELPGDCKPKGWAERELEAMNVGTVVRKARPASKARVVSATGPNAHYRAMQARAAALRG